MNIVGRILVIVAAFNVFFQVSATEIVIVNVGESEDDTRIEFKNDLVKRALELTKEQYGDYKIVENPQRMNISRAFRELENGKTLSLTFAHTRPEFEKKALAIKIPLRGGISSYRLLVVKKGDEARFTHVNTLAELKQFKVGLSRNWSTFNIMESHGFNIVDASVYSSMFKMLESERFDYVPRALNEVYGEIETYKPIDDGLAIVPQLALYIPSASYMFVSPKQEILFERLNSALHAMSINGQLAELNDRYFKEFVVKARIQNRRIISIEHERLIGPNPNTQILPDCIGED